MKRSGSLKKATKKFASVLLALLLSLSITDLGHRFHAAVIFFVRHFISRYVATMPLVRLQCPFCCRQFFQLTRANFRIFEIKCGQRIALAA
jgi:hypothetical protein